MDKRHERLSRIPALAVVGLAVALCASVLVAAWAPPVVTWLDVGSPGDEAYTRFDFPPESNGTETFRWTSSHAELEIPVERAGRYRLDLLLATVSPEGRVLRVSCGEQIYDIPLTGIVADSTVPIECRSDGGRIEVAFDVPVVWLPNGGRALGVSVRDVQATALDRDDRLAFRAYAGLTIFGSLAGAGFAMAALGRGGGRIRGRLWLAGPALLLVAWIGLVATAPGKALSAVRGPEGVVILAAGVTAWLLATDRHRAALAVAALAALAAIAIPEPGAALLLEAPWTRTEVNALHALPGLAAIAVVSAATLGGRRGPWLAVAGAAVGIISLAMPTVSSWTVRQWTHQIEGPAWIDTGSIAGAVYVLSAFAVAGLAILVVRSVPERVLLRVTLAATTIIAALLLWRVEVMRFNGDEQHYYVTARSIAVDGDLELLNNYLEPEYIESTYSPIGNIFPSRDTAVIRYAGSVPATAGAWYLIPSLDDGWEAEGGVTGLIPASEPAPTIQGPDGALAIPPPLTPANRHALLLDAPCAVTELALAAPEGAMTGGFNMRLHNAAGELLWQDRRDALPPGGLLPIPAAAGLCQGAGAWAITVEAEQTPLVVEAIDRYRGLVLAGGALQDGWLFAGLPRDRYGSVDMLTHVLVHNPTDETILVTVRLLTPSNLTTSEISIGLEPGQTIIEPLPVLGAHAVAVQTATPTPEGTQFGAALYGFVDQARYRVPPTEPVASFAARVEANPDRDAGLWLTIVNPDGDPMHAELQDGDALTTLDICEYCATTHHIEAGNAVRTAHVSGVDGALFAPAVIAYEERTDELHFDLGLPLLAAPLAGFEVYWPVLLATALAGISLAPGLFLLLRSSGVDSRSAGTLALLTLMVAPVSTYAVRFYTDIVTAALLVWALVLWSHAERSRPALAGMAAIAVALPFVHGRLTPLAVVVLGLALLAATRPGTKWAGTVLQRYPRRITISAAVMGLIAVAVAGVIVTERFAVALGSRGIENFFSLDWAARNSVGMLLDRGSGVFPFIPWMVFALAVPRPLHRVQRAALLLTLVYYTLLTLRSGGWQTFGSPLRYLLPVIPLMATLALPGLLRLWRSGQPLLRVAIAASLGWSVLVTMMLHWRPLSGYIDRGGPRNNYLMDQALSWWPWPSPFEFMPTIEAEPGPAWAEPFGIAILVALTVAAGWVAWRTARATYGDTRPYVPEVASIEKETR